MPTKTYRDISKANRQPERKARSKDQKDPYKPYKSIKRYPYYTKDRGGRDYSRPSRGRRRFEAYALEDPQEARAVSEAVFDGTILERIIYKRNLVLFGPEGPSNWTTQTPAMGGRNIIGGIAIDFVYWFTVPPLAFEPQGEYWHGPFEDFGDAARAMIIQSFGFRYAELFETEILNSTDEELDNRLRSIIGQTTDPNPSAYLQLSRPLIPFGAIVSGTFKERRRDL